MAVKKPKINKLLTKVNFTDANRKKSEIKYLVKHYVGATGSAKDNCKFFKDVYRGASAHYFVNHDGQIWQCVEENDIAWHCGASKYKHPECRNSNSIGIELCVKKDKNGKWYYTEETKKAAAVLFAYLMDKYDIAEDHVLRHYDVTGKTCGEPDVRSGNKVWSEFKKDIKAIRKGNGSENKKPEEPKKENNGFKPYTVNTTCDALRVRSGAGTQYRVVDCIREKNGNKKDYTIVAEKNGWGKLKSGAGYISLACTKKKE